MNVLLTGSAGFIGSHIADALTAAGHTVRGLDQRADGEPADVRDAPAVARALHGVDAVCHQAAMVGLGVDVFDLPAYVSANAHGTAVLLAEMARAGVGALVVASSMVVYGEGAYSCARHGAVRPGPRGEEALRAGRFEPGCPRCGDPLEPGTVGEDTVLDPRNVYADTKVAQEHLATSWARMTGGSVVALRYHNVYGPRMPLDTPYAGVAALFRSRLERGEPPLVFEDGGQRRDFVHVRDVARANVLALERVVAGGAEAFRAYNIASGEPRTITDMAEALAAAYGGPAPQVTGGYRIGDVRHIMASSDRARRELGFAPEVPFDDGMAEFAACGVAA
ncbi:NAD-dependent epimerase/dehydratase family protein [Actinomadura rudentiformis]|uniref:NAD-dependent epimerase/dehydratase family protein n=1 Tax=Actinomadura rudentiformis TaxID=359158 RepID=A0A6H9YYL2_9ACTN|nr:NAD-dependent epimerase/dehydratase family protein [Actinomadura rudentiformis]KAB2346430.1 NAD-dependent epimerase/dehydratase family protein [Actinomadura rudentiformis]